MIKTAINLSLYTTATTAADVRDLLQTLGYQQVDLYAAYLGGDMIFAKGTGVNHTAWEVGSYAAQYGKSLPARTTGTGSRQPVDQQMEGESRHLSCV